MVEEDVDKQIEIRNGNKSSYRQRYKHAWELDNELKGWLTACNSDAYAAFCRYCRTKLHAHKKGLLAHAKSAKHKKHMSNSSFSNDNSALTPASDLQNNGSGGDFDNDNDSNRGGQRRLSSKNHHRFFNESWLKEPSFSAWLRKVPNNNTKALCIACRCVITAGRCELIKHTRAAKHQKALSEGPFEEVVEGDLQWLDFAQADQNNHNYSHRTYDSSHHQDKHYLQADLPGMLVDELLERLNKYVPLELAEKWDNVGIIAEPTQPIRVYNILLTIDLNEEIVEEAIKKRVQLIISYHPPIFHPLKKLNRAQSRTILLCIEHKITIYSPHTALDAIRGGVNDWLISPFLTNDENKIEPIQHKDTACFEVVLTDPQVVVSAVEEDVTMAENEDNIKISESQQPPTTSSTTTTTTTTNVTCDNPTTEIVETQLAHHSYAPVVGIGMGRVLKLTTPITLHEVIGRTKMHLGVDSIKVGLSRKHTRATKISSIAVCAGSGIGVLKGCQAEVWITGEMSHHEILDAIKNGTTVILGDHSNTERGFLRDWCQQLRTTIFEDKVMVIMSELDRDPLRNL